jgi:hypothetical protein
MITIKRNEEIEVYQVELALKFKTKQSPFIAILILAQEQDGISALALQQQLLTTLPVRACGNLLKRLEQQGYLQEIEVDMFGEINYALTTIGEDSAIDKSFWIGEKGLYNVFLSNNDLIDQRIIKTEKVERPEDDRHNNILRTPSQIAQYENRIISINEAEVMIEDVERKCFQIKPANCILDVVTNASEARLNVSKDGQTLYQTDIDIEEEILKRELLETCDEFEYDPDENAILTEFNSDNLSFNRKVKITKPFFHGNHFNQVELENVCHIPYDKENADRWYWELLFQNMTEYFPDEKSFNEFATNLAKLFLPHFDLTIPTSKEMVFILEGRSDSFYQIAKLDTINYLNYF